VTVFFPILFLGFCGLVLGILLGAASRKFRAARESRAQKIHSVLPLADCGACGFRSCLAFAQAVADGKTGATGCTPGGSKAAHAIADILGIQVSPADPLMAVVRCKGGAKESSRRSMYDGLFDCHAAILAGNGHIVCADGCLGMGSCVASCSFRAISIDVNGIAVVNPDRCTGCGACVRSCPRSIITLIPRVHKIFLACSNHDRGARVKKYCTVGCTACTLCVKATPSGAIAMEHSLPVLNYAVGENFVVAAYTCPSACFVDLVKFRPKINIDAKCDGCGECVASCPTAAISGEKGLRHFVNKEKCIGCGLCLNTCHVHAIAMWGGLGYAEDGKSRRKRG
jgi:Na+-translocating ferredoxin:NAD+ oxidoreductase subunit B